MISTTRSAAVLLALSLAACGASHAATEPVPAQTAAAKPAPAQPVSLGTELTSVPAGTELRVRLDRPISELDAEPGDWVSAHVAESVYSDGVLAIPAGTRVMGHVVATDGAVGPALSVRFDVAELDGSPIAMHASPVEPVGSLSGGALDLRLERDVRLHALEPSGKPGEFYAPGPSTDPEEDPSYTPRR